MGELLLCRSWFIKAGRLSRQHKMSTEQLSVWCLLFLCVYLVISGGPQHQ